MKNLIPWRRKKNEVEVLRPQDDPTYGLTTGMADMVNDLFRRFDDDFGGLLFRGMPGFTAMPSIDIAETDDAVTVSADLPGLTEKDIHVSLDGDYLTLKGERKMEHEETHRNYRRMERSYGSFHRTVALPEGIDRDDVKATFRNGELWIRVGKLPGAKPSGRRIKIEAA